MTCAFVFVILFALIGTWKNGAVTQDYLRHNSLFFRVDFIFVRVTKTQQYILVWSFVFSFVCLWYIKRFPGPGGTFPAGFHSWQSAIPESSRIEPPSPNPENLSRVPPDVPANPPELACDPKPNALDVVLCSILLCLGIRGWICGWVACGGSGTLEAWCWDCAEAECWELWISIKSILVSARAWPNMAEYPVWIRLLSDFEVGKVAMFCRWWCKFFRNRRRKTTSK